MDIGIGVPNMVPDATGPLLIDWMRRADERGFSTLASIGRVAYPGYEELTVFGAGAAVTSRIRFLTNVLVGPLRSSAELAKQAATVDQLSGGRLTLGLAVGSREDDYVMTGRDYRTRGRQLDRQIAELRAAWAGEPLPGSPKPVCPRPVRDEGIPIMIGGTSDPALRRMAALGDGWLAGGVRGVPSAQRLAAARQAWEAAGRPGTPPVIALAYVAIGEEAGERGRDYVRDYYSQMGPVIAGGVADAVLTTTDELRASVEAFAASGVDELMLLPAVADAGLVDVVADAVLPG